MPSERNHFAIAGRPASIAVTAVLIVVALTQCRMVGDRLTGIGAGGATSYQTAACVQACQETFKRCRDVEDERHRAALRECDLLPTASEREACRTAEGQRHEAEKDACQRTMVQCKQDCHYAEASGAGGR
jgi:hypothetical protein